MSRIENVLRGIDYYWIEIWNLLKQGMLIEELWAYLHFFFLFSEFVFFIEGESGR